MSRYKLSNSTPFGFGSAEFTGTHTPSVAIGWKKCKDLSKFCTCNMYKKSMRFIIQSVCTMNVTSHFNGI